MKDKRKEILRDLLGEFATDGEPEDEKGEAPEETPVRRDLHDNGEEESFKLDKIMKKPSKKAPKKMKKVSGGSEAEIVKEGVIPHYNVTLPKFSDSEQELFDEIRGKLVEVAVSQGEDFNIDEDSGRSNFYFCQPYAKSAKT